MSPALCCSLQCGCTAVRRKQTRCGAEALRVLQEYFFPKEKTGDDEQVTKRRETWRKNMDGKLRSKRSSAASEAGAALPAHELSGLKLGRPDVSRSAVTTPQVASIAAGEAPPPSVSTTQ